MSEVDAPNPQPLESTRIPLEREVVLEFEHFSNFVREYSANLSLGGMFVKTETPKLPGSVFRFEIGLEDDFKLVTGLGKVLWVREMAEGEDRPAGMGIQFLEIDAEGRALIQRMVEDHRASGGEPFDLTPPAPPPGAAAPDAGTEPGPVADAAPPPEDGPAPGAEAAAPPPPILAEEPAAAPLTPPPDAAAERPPPPSRSGPLPSLDELLEPRPVQRTAVLDTPPRGWKPRTFAVRPQTRFQMLAWLAVGGAIVAVLTLLALRYFAQPPELADPELRPRELPAATAGDAAEEAPPSEPFGAIESIAYRRDGDALVFEIRGDGAFAEERVVHDRLASPPRELVRLLGATRPYERTAIEVGAGGVRQLRVGFHEQPDGDELHLVVDLVDQRVGLRRIEREGAVLRLVLAPG